MKAKSLSAVLVALAVLSGMSAQAAQAKRVIITFKAGTPALKRQAALDKLGAQKVSEAISNDQSKSLIVVVADVTKTPAAPSGFAGGDGKSIMSLDAAPSLAPEVEKVEEDFKVKWIEAMPAFEAPSATLGSLNISAFKRSAESMKMTTMAMHPSIPWGVEAVHAPAAWSKLTGKGVKVAVIDTGINFKHRDLSGQVAGGYNAITDCAMPECYKDDNGHGTHVAGTIAGKRTGRAVGVAPEASLYAVKVLDADGSGNLSDVIKGIIWAANNGIQVANMSLGSPMPSDTMQRALRYAKARGVVVVAAAGNSGGSVGYPGAYPETIAVAAADYQGNIAAFSSRGDEVKFIAPGVDIYSTSITGDYVTMSGTSMASPHVAGLAALVVQEGYRGLTGPDGVMGQLQQAATPLKDLTAQEQGAGMIDAGKLVEGDSAMVASLQAQ